MQGVKAGSRLPARAKGNPADGDTAELLPSSLEESIAALEKDQGDCHMYRWHRARVLEVTATADFQRMLSKRNML